MSSSSTWAFTNFYPRPPRGGRPSRPRSQPTWAAFLSTPSARRATRLIRTMEGFRKYFYPRPPRGGRPARSGLQNQPRGYFYPRPPRGGRPGKCVDWLHFQKISIHALREEGDPTVPPLAIDDGQFLSTPSARRATLLLFHAKPYPVISIHALREEGDATTDWSNSQSSTFLSTPSARRATLNSLNTGTGGADFYPRPPRGGRPSLPSL